MRLIRFGALTSVIVVTAILIDFWIACLLLCMAIVAYFSGCLDEHAKFRADLDALRQSDIERSAEHRAFQENMRRSWEAYRARGDRP